jgi:glycosyltransferase involved in cell wall biosynthesis
MRILYIVPYVPSLIRVRPYQLIRNLSLRGHQVTLATLWENAEERDTLRSLEGSVERIIAIPQPRWRSLLNCVLAIPTSTPLQATYCWNPRLQKELLHLTRDDQGIGGWDVIHIEHLRGARFGIALTEKWAHNSYDPSYPPIIWDSVDSISSLFRQTSLKSQKRFNRWLAKIELLRTEAFERRAVEQFDRVLVTSTIDQRAFWELDPEGGTNNKVSVLANGVDLDTFHPDYQVRREPASLIVHGKMSYHANVTMVFHLVKDILPMVWKERPDVKLWIVGKDPPKEMRMLNKNPAICVTGTVEDIQTYLQKATIAVAPVAYGAGIQNKVLEAMACATPVIASPQAVSALEVEAGRELLIENDPAEFSGTILELLADSERQHFLGQAGRRYVEIRHDWRKIVTQLENIYIDAMHEKESICKQ